MNTASTYIEKNAPKVESEDYHFLREKGYKHIESMATQLWTDFNIHDPGITTLEMLCYAITDLGYRTSYPIEDILAEESQENVSQQDDTQSKPFFTARKILTCNPVTCNDYRKLIIDIPGVKNAWLKIVDKYEPQVYVNCKSSRLTLFNTKQYMPIHIRGLYNVLLEFEDDPQLNSLNQFVRRFFIENEDIEVELRLPTWDQFCLCKEITNKIDNSTYTINLADVEHIEFKPFSYDKSLKLYTGIMEVEFKENIKEEFTYKVSYKVQKRAITIDDIDNKILNHLNQDDDLKNQYLSFLERGCSIVQQVSQTLHSHRNLCEDFHEFQAVIIDDIVVCADIEIASDADVEEVAAEIYYQLDLFLSPPVQFYTIEELLDREKTADEIFEGPILNHGFIDDWELENSNFKKELHVSDLIQIIMDVHGVVAVKTIMVNRLQDGIPYSNGEKWCLPLEPDHAAQLNRSRSKLTFYKQKIPFSPNSEEVEQFILEKEALLRHKRLGIAGYDFPIPQGRFRDIQQYYSIQNDYPLCYSIGPEGLPDSATLLRKAQAKQLKAYLLLYDQLLANYFSQLAHVKDLFSLNPEIQKTYFSQPLYEIKDLFEPDVPGIKNLYLDFVEYVTNLNDADVKLNDEHTFQAHWNQWLQNTGQSPGDYLKTLYEREERLEDQTTYEDRRNRFLDHLIARFCEKFTDYVLLMYNLDRRKAPLELIEDKLAFLRDYPTISSERGKAFDYKQYDSYEDSVNVSGLQKRVSRLLGINSYQRKKLYESMDSYFEIYQEKDTDPIDEFRFRLLDDNNNILLSSTKNALKKDDLYKTIKLVKKFAVEQDHYQLKQSDDGKFYFNLLDDKNDLIARRIQYFDTEEERDQEIQKIITFLSSLSDCEGFHILEHILLRPGAKNHPMLEEGSLLPVCASEDCQTCSGFLDPYSFRVTAVLPQWLNRFQNMDFRTFFESVIRQEAPAHVHVKICWVDQPSMKRFEECYEIWLQRMAEPCPDHDKLFEAKKNLIHALNSLRSVYPEARLHDCIEGNDINPVLLNQTVLGTSKEDQDNGTM